MKMNLGSPPQPTLPHIAVCPLPESETNLLGQTTMISGQRKGKDLTCSPPLPIVCAVLPVQRRLLPLLGFHGKTARREACECLPSKPPKNCPSPGRTDISSCRTGCRGCHRSTSNVPFKERTKDRNTVLAPCQNTRSPVPVSLSSETPPAVPAPILGTRNKHQHCSLSLASSLFATKLTNPKQHFLWHPWS